METNYCSFTVSINKLLYETVGISRRRYFSIVKKHDVIPLQKSEIVLHLGIGNNILRESANNVFVFISDKCEVINI